MDRISFSCSGCGAKLGVGSALRGKSINCPKCQHKSEVPAFEVVDEPEPSPPPPPPPAELIRFPCAKCSGKLRVSAEMAGRGIVCPKCGQNTLVPDLEEIGSYDLGAKTRPTAAPREAERPLAEWWPDGAKLNLPFSWRGPLATAREYAENERWTKALGVLNELFQKGIGGKGNAGTHVLRKPLSFCLGRWAVRELDRLEEDGEQLSKPIRKVLKLAAEQQRFAGQFNSFECPLCGRKFQHLEGRTPLRTVAGPAYMCCAYPSRSDDALIEAVDRINKKLTVGMSLDGDNTEIPIALARLPGWYRALDLHKRSAIRSVEDGPDGGGGVMGDAAGDMAGHLVAEIISSLL